jgi:hypothetical protein
MLVERELCAALLRTKPMTKMIQSWVMAARANDAARSNADSQTSRQRPSRSEPMPERMLPRIAPTERAGKIRPMAAKVRPADENSVVITGMTEGMRMAAVPMKRYPMRLKLFRWRFKTGLPFEAVKM